jgi:DNA (cytosine-5)-methyltransferase 1
MPSASFTFIDLFAGIGGTRKGFESAGGRCIFTSEWDKYARRTYSINFREPEENIAGDIWSIPLDSIPQHDVLVGGFPCQPFSLAGVSKKNALGRAHGFACEAQGTVFFRVAEIIKHLRPAAFMLENVKHLVSHNKGHTFRVIRYCLEKELGYHISWKVIDGSRWTPQKRRRIFIVGFRDDVGFKWPDESSWPTPEDVKVGSILEPNHLVDPKFTLSDELWTYLRGYKAKHSAAGNGFGCSVVRAGDVTRTLSARYHKDGSEILVYQGPRKNPRKLTPRECARLMGFEDNFVLPVSNTQLYQQFGNSVVVPAVKAVAAAMVPYLRKTSQKRSDVQQAIATSRPVVVLKDRAREIRRPVTIPKVA